MCGMRADDDAVRIWDLEVAEVYGLLLGPASSFVISNPSSLIQVNVR